MVTKEEVKNKLEELIKDYNQSYSKEEKESMSEDATRRKFIDRLLKEVLGWDERDLDSQTPIESLTPEGHMKRADYSYPKVPKIIVEAKKLKIEIDDGDYDKQVTDYAYSKAVNWAILTNFKSFRVWYVTRKKINWFCRLNILEDNIDQAVDELFYFTKDNIFNGALDKRAEVRGIKLQEIDITADLTESLNISRQKINNYLKRSYERKYSEEEREELTQGVINRLIFIKKVEAEGLEENKLEQVVRKERMKVYDKVIEIFSYYRRKYDSDIFGLPEDKAEVEKLEIDDSFATELLKVISNPLDSDRAYNFAAMDVDVLGSIYENYLAYIQKGIKLVGGKEKRKGQGIYYTPRYIVDFITRNTLESVITNKTLLKGKEIKILDPACGSGSFLVSSIQKLDEYYKKVYKNYAKLSMDDRLRLIKNNIYGVDLDERAVSIAKLNIYLQVLTQKGQSSVREHHTLLPELKGNIKVGNSLIDKNEIAGERAFIWDMEFKEIMNTGGFDVIIGNPPWIFTRGEHFSDAEKNYFEDFLIGKGIVQTKKGKNVQSGKLNLYSLFILKAINLMKEGGIFGFIIPNNLLRTTTYDMVRKYILDNCKIVAIVDLSTGVFKGVKASSVIIIFKKDSSKKARDENEIKILSEVQDLAAGSYETHSLKQKYFYQNVSYSFNIFSNSSLFKLNQKINDNCEKLGNLCQYIIEGIVGSLDRDVSNKKISDIYKPFLLGKDIGRYKIEYKGRYICYDKNRLHRARPEEVFLSKKLVIQRISGGNNPLVAALDVEKYYTFASINNLVLKEDSGYDIKYILALLNSRLINWYYSTNFSNKSLLTVNISKTYLEQLPIKKISEKKQREVVALVDKMLIVESKIKKLGEKRTEQYAKLEEEQKRIDKEINELVYDIYGISKDEVESIAEGL